ncbi:MAG TPA: rhomboid family intramembrane serine protease [Albidovulum sp.]|uniref:rhomboid family intramembrane serine protease n=1 Tax=Albidovulum sp. TaxID=1872424 RepID=UPI002C10E813|nr:rhomboid family intramembrane serine protease [Albidovulum sp.]
MPDGFGTRRPVPPAVWFLTFLSVVPEVVLTGADLGLWGNPDWRVTAYQYGAFWAGLLQGWQPTYAGQPWLMFVTYGFLHGGLSHLALNMATLVAFGAVLVPRFGTASFLALYGLSQIGGGLAFTWLAPDGAPMVGASGAIFGLAGAFLATAAVQLKGRQRSIAPVLQSLGGLVLLNVVLWWAMAGGLAWQAHLGGAVAGALYTLAAPPRRA